MSPTGKVEEYTSEYGIGAISAFESLNEQGTYLSNWSGHLIRVPADAIKPGRIIFDDQKSPSAHQLNYRNSARQAVTMLSHRNRY